MFFGCFGNVDVEVYRWLNGVVGEVVELFSIYFDDIGWSLCDIESCWGVVVVVKVNFE